MSDLVEAGELAVKHADFVPGISILFDFREATLNLTAGDERALGMFRERYCEARGRGRSAFVVSREVDFGVIRQFDSLATSRAFDLRVFRDLDEAQAWLSESTSV